MLALTLFLILCGSGIAQDIITKKDGTKIEAKVIEIDQTHVKYRLHTQPEGPDRIIAISQLNKIIYEDGQFDDFMTKDKSTSTSEVKETPQSTTPYYFKSGTFFDGSIGFGENYRNDHNFWYYYDEYGNMISQSSQRRTNYITLGFRFGSRWYFGQNEKWRPGIQVNWIRLGMYLDPNYPESILIGPKTFSVCNVGMANGFRLNDKMGLEVNFTTGLLMNMDLDYSYFGGSFTVTPEVKLRINKFAIGIDYQYAKSIINGPNISDQWHILSVSTGVKF